MGWTSKFSSFRVFKRCPPRFACIDPQRITIADTMPTKSHVEADKGAQVRIAGGKHKGRTGWVHMTANKFEEKQWIIVQAGRNSQGRQEPDTARLIKKDHISYQLVEPAPATFEQALLREHSDIKEDFEKLAVKLSEFDGYGPNTNMAGVFLEMWCKEKAKRDSMNRVTGARFVRTFQIEADVNWTQSEIFFDTTIQQLGDLIPDNDSLLHMEEDGSGQ